MGRGRLLLERGARGAVPGGVEGAAYLKVVIERVGLGGGGTERQQQNETEGGSERCRTGERVTEG